MQRPSIESIESTEPITPVESSNVVPTAANFTSEKPSVAKIPIGRVQHYGDFTPGDAATVQRYGDFTPGDTATVRHYGDFTPDDTETVQRYGKSSVEQSIGDGATNKFNAVTMSLPKGQLLRDRDYAVSDRTVESSRIILVSRSSKNAYVYWEVSPTDREAAKQQGGTQLTLRVYEVTNIDMDDIPAHSVQQFECDEQQQDRSVAIPVGDRDYVAEIGYTTAEGHWLSIIRSLHVRVPAV